MRRSARSWLRSIAFACLTAMPLAVSAQGANPLAPDEDASLQEIRDFVEATAQRFRMVAPLEISVASRVGSNSLPQFASSPAVYTGGTLYLNRRLLRAQNRDLVVATALAYEMLRAPTRATTLAERERERAQMVLDGNAKAVEVLIQVKEMSEQAALDQMYARLLGMHRATLASSRPPQPGSVPPCEAIEDLLRRYPGAKEWFAGRDCAPA